MHKLNPLYTTPCSPNDVKDSKFVINPKGRPPKKQTKIFSTPPKSTVSRIIQKMMAENNVKLPLKFSFEETVVNNEEIEEDTKPHFNNPQERKLKPWLYCCDYLDCQYSTKLSSNLLKHKRTHTKEKPYLCDRCAFRTNFCNSLKAHKRLHTKERPYQCNDCGYSCNSISNLKKHSHSKHRNNKIVNQINPRHIVKETLDNT